MDQMRRYGIPASVILAQGIIESANGQSELSRLGNNHFGIKATSSWLDNGGRYLVYTDDRPDEKFCSYPSAAESYEHHSRFLKENSRYASLFNLRVDDYAGWADGLQKAGYATSNSYAETLKSVIRANGLEKFDQQVMKESCNRQQSAVRMADSPLTSGEKHYSFPLESREFLLITSPYGTRKDPKDPSKQQMHKGIDLRADHVKVLSTEDGGKVVSVNQDAGKPGGRSVTVEYEREQGRKILVSYCHLDSISVRNGDTVRAGQQLAISGNTGSRTTGPHLHMGVSIISAGGQKRDMDPVAYLADLAVRGGIQQQVMHNGENLLNRYVTPEERETELGQAPGDTPLSAADWMKRLLSSEDAPPGVSADPLLDAIVSIFSTLMALALKIDGGSHEEQMQQATDAALDRRLDLTGMVSGVRDCAIVLPKEGRAQLVMAVGDKKLTHSLSENEARALSSSLEDPSLPESDKVRKVNALVNGIILRERLSDNYEQQLGQGQSQGVQR